MAGEKIIDRENLLLVNIEMSDAAKMLLVGKDVLKTSGSH